jgi:hypothetical protein
VVTLEQMATALLAVVESLAGWVEVLSGPEVRSSDCVKSPASSGVQRHRTQEVTLQTKVIA